MKIKIFVFLFLLGVVLGSTMKAQAWYTPKPTYPPCEEYCGTPTPSVGPTNTPVPTLEASPSATPVPNVPPPSDHGDGLSDGRSDGKSDGKSDGLGCGTHDCNSSFDGQPVGWK